MTSESSSSNSISAPSGALERPNTGQPLGRGAVLAWLAFAVLLYLLQTVPYLSYRWVTDESWFSGTAYSIAHGNGIANPAFGSNYIVSRCDTHPPGAAIVIAAFFRLLGTSPVTARLGSVLAGLLIVLFTYWLARDVIGVEGAIVATFILATDNLVILTSRTARPEALTTMAVLASLLAMKKYWRTDALLWAFLSGFLIAMATMFHVTVLGYIVALGVLAMVFDHRRDGFPLRGATCYAVGYGLGVLPFVIWILTAPLGRAGFKEEYLSRAAGSSIWSRLQQEAHRYSDLFGFNMLPGHRLESIPVRLPIPLFLLAVTFFLWKRKRQWFYLELLLILPTALWLVYTPDKMSRYLALIAPVLALTVGSAVAVAKRETRLYRVLLSLSCLTIAAQLAANLFLLHSAHKADYNKVSIELQSVIPQGQTVYGTATFWMALRDRHYISYERTDPSMARNRFHARYFITGDRVMNMGLPGDMAFYQSLRRDVAMEIARAKLVGHFTDPYYGDLKVYDLDEF